MGSISCNEDKEELYIIMMMTMTTTKKMTKKMMMTTMRMMMDVCTVINELKTCHGSVSSMTMMMMMMMILITIVVVLGTSRSGVMIVEDIFVMAAIGVMNSKRIMRYGCVIDVMHFTVVDVMKWTNVMIVVRSFVDHVRHC